MATPPTISEGARGPTVRWAQYLIAITRETSLDYTQIDSIFGPETKNGVEQFQASSGLGVDGIVGPATWGALHGDRAEPPTLEQGANGSLVEKLQTALNDGRGDFSPDNGPPLVVDGQYGLKTAAEVKGTQQMASATADGIVGLQTWALPVHADGMMLGGLCGVL
jgi:murein L,D-transpeptidase YcbB/YkuD